MDVGTTILFGRNRGKLKPFSAVRHGADPAPEREIDFEGALSQMKSNSC
jgi:hypothetical protein